MIFLFWFPKNIQSIHFKMFLLLSSLLFSSCGYRSSANDRPHDRSQWIRNSEENIYISGETFSDTIDFTDLFLVSHLGSGKREVNVPVNIVFENCIFNAPVKAAKEDSKGWILTFFGKNVTFINCDFKEEFNFRGTTIAGNLVLTSNTFYKTARLQGFSTRGQAIIRSNHFFEDALFQGSKFHDATNFHETYFHKTVNFQGSYFHDNMQWSLIRILGYGDFTLTDFNRDFIFNYTECPGTIVFDHSFFRKRADIVGSKFNHLSIRSCFFHKLLWKDQEISGSLNFDDNQFIIPPENEIEQAISKF